MSERYSTDGAPKGSWTLPLLCAFLLAFCGCQHSEPSQSARRDKPKTRKIAKPSAEPKVAPLIAPAVQENPSQPTDAGENANPAEAEAALPDNPAPSAEETEQPAASDTAPPETPVAVAKPETAPAAATDFTDRLAKLESTKAQLANAEDEEPKEAFIADALGLIDAAVAEDSFDAAKKALDLAGEIAPSLADQELANEIIKSKRRVQQFEAAFKKVAAARQTLGANPDDAASNHTVGAYVCFLKGDWDAGLPHFAKGNDAVVRKTAQQDLAAPTEAAARQAVGDAWWTVAGRENGIAKANAMLRARKWYNDVRPTLDTEGQEKLRSRIEMIDKYAVSTGVNIALGLDAELPEATGKLTIAQRSRVQKLLGDVRRAAGSPSQLETAATKLLAIGGPATSQLLVEVNKQLQPQLRKYGESFQAQAAAIQASRGGANAAEVARLRAEVLALKELPNLTKDMIVQTGDPAMAKLHEMLVVDRAMVLEKSARLREERGRLLALGRQWERATIAMIQAMQEEQAKAAAANKSTKTVAAATKGDATAEQSAAGQSPPSFAKYLEGEEELAAKMTMPMDDTARAVLAENGKLIGQIETEEVRAILACNLTRQLLGLSALKIDLKLCSASRDHSKDMATLNFFAHESPVPGKTTPWDRAKNFGTSASGENIAAGYADGNAANQGWFHSPGHHKNMLGNHNRIGLGVHNTHYTEMFGN